MAAEDVAAEKNAVEHYYDNLNRRIGVIIREKRHEELFELISEEIAPEAPIRIHLTLFRNGKKMMSESVALTGQVLQGMAAPFVEFSTPGKFESEMTISAVLPNAHGGGGLVKASLVQTGQATALDTLELVDYKTTDNCNFYYKTRAGGKYQLGEVTCQVQMEIVNAR